MKKILASVVLALFMVVSFCGCGSESSNEVKATIVNNDGVTEQLTYSELYSIDFTNEMKYKNLYKGASATVTGKITKIVDNINLNGIFYNWIVYVGDWFVGDYTYNKPSVSKDFIATLNVGDTVELKGHISAGVGNLSDTYPSITKK